MHPPPAVVLLCDEAALDTLLLLAVGIDRPLKLDLGFC